MPMPAPRASVTTFSLLLALCFSGSVLALRRVDEVRSGATLEEVLYVPSPKMVKRMSLGYTGLAADIYWTRAVQYFGRKHHEKARDYALLPPLLDITTTLDPHLVVAYTNGAMFLTQKPPEGAGMPDKAVELLQRGIRENPGNWELYYNLGFVHYMDRQDYVAAARAFQAGSEQPNAHPWLRILAANMAQRGNDAETASAIWTIVYETTNDDLIKLNAAKHLRALYSDAAVGQLDNMIAEWRRRNGSPPASFAEMVGAGWLRRVPLDPTGKPYRLMPGGRVEVASYFDLPFITRGLPPGQLPSSVDAQGAREK